MSGRMGGFGVLRFEKGAGVGYWFSMILIMAWMCKETLEAMMSRSTIQIFFFSVFGV